MCILFVFVKIYVYFFVWKKIGGLKKKEENSLDRCKSNDWKVRRQRKRQYYFMRDVTENFMLNFGAPTSMGNLAHSFFLFVCVCLCVGG